MADCYGRTYEFVTKKELEPVKKKIESIIDQLHKAMHTYGVTFQQVLIGSAGKNLVTRVSGGNKGFDFDYNFSIQKNTKEMSAKELKDAFLLEINKILKLSGYNNAENNSRAITIKLVDKKLSKIIHGCDFAIIQDYEEEGDMYQQILVHEKTSEKYFWNKRPLAKNYGVKLSNLKANGLWEELKEEYLKLKNNNQDSEKLSFSLFFEAINNVYNRYKWV